MASELHFEDLNKFLCSEKAHSCVYNQFSIYGNKLDTVMPPLSFIYIRLENNGPSLFPEDGAAYFCETLVIPSRLTS